MGAGGAGAAVFAGAAGLAAPSFAGALIAVWAAVRGTINGCAQNGHLIFLPARSSRPLNFLTHFGQVITGLAMSSSLSGRGHPGAKAIGCERFAGAASSSAPSCRILVLPGRRQAAMAPSGPSAPPLDRALVCMATYNERENLASLIQEIHKVVPAVDVLVIDDNSPDGTGQIADQLAAADPRVHVIHRAGK